MQATPPSPPPVLSYCILELEAIKAKNPSWMISANNSPQTPYMAIISQSGHILSSYLAGVFPSASGRVHASGAGRQDIPCIANCHRTCSRQTATVVPGRTEAQAGQRPGAGPQRPQQEPLQEPHACRTPAGASGSAGSCAETYTPVRPHRLHRRSGRPVRTPRDF